MLYTNIRYVYGEKITQEVDCKARAVVFTPQKYYEEV